MPLQGKVAGDRGRTRQLARGLTARLALAAGTLASGALAGCGSPTPTLHGSSIASSIARAIVAGPGEHLAVTCPRAVPMQLNLTFRCATTLAGTQYAVTVTEIDGVGHVHWTVPPQATVDTVRVQTAIERSVSAQRGVQADVSCPAYVVREKGLSFTCTAVVTHGTPRVHAGRYRFGVTETDAAGDVNFIGR